MNDFFKQFEKKQSEVKGPEPEVKQYPAWVLQSSNPDKAIIMFDVVEDLYKKAKRKIKSNDFKKASEIKISQSLVCENIPFLKGRSGLKNHSKIVDWIEERNKDLVKLLLEVKAKGSTKSTARKTKDMLRIERDEYKGKHEAKTKIEMEHLIQSEMLVSHADAIRVNAEQRQTINDLHTEIAEVKHANKSLQEEVRALQEKLFKAQKKPVLKVKK